MRDVYLIGIGQTDVTKDGVIRGRYIAKAAIEKALAHAGLGAHEIDMLVVGNMMSGILAKQQQMGALIADVAGMRGIEAATVEAGCASGAAAARWGYTAVAGGLHDRVVVCGIERMTHAPKEEITAALSTAADWQLEGIHNHSFVSLNAKIMKLYMETHKIAPENFAHFSINAHANGLNNPHAFLKKHVDMNVYMSSKMLNEPIRLFDAPPVCDGSAAIVLASEAVARAAQRQGLPLIRIRASAIGTDCLALDNRKDPLELSGAKLSGQRALKQAGITIEDLDLFELHDAYTIITSLSLEAAGFAEKGRGVFYGQDGAIGRSGKLPISTMGGLKSRGHPVGATGVYQMVETYQQLTGTAGVNQVPNAGLAMVQNIGGTGATVVTHIMERMH